FEESDMERLRKKSLRGWHIKKFSFFGYRLERGEPTDVIYTIDYHLLNEEDQEEYFDMFKMAGWEHVCTEYNMHIFKAPRGTKPIYSDSRCFEYMHIIFCENMFPSRHFKHIKVYNM